MNSERSRFFLFLFSWDNLKVCNERRHSIAILGCISEPKLCSNLARCVRYMSSFVFRLIYFTARNVKEVLFEKFVQYARARMTKFMSFCFIFTAAINAQKRLTILT